MSCPHSAASHTIEPNCRVRLLQGSTEFFPSLIDAIDNAQQFVHLESYIFDLTNTGAHVANALINAAMRGVTVRVLIDGVGSHNFPLQWLERFQKTGIEFQMYRPVHTWNWLRQQSWRRLHRKLCIVDGSIGFCGGINILDDCYDPNHGALTIPRLDYSIKITGGKILDDIQHAMRKLWYQATNTVEQNTNPSVLRTKQQGKHRLFHAILFKTNIKIWRSRDRKSLALRTHAPIVLTLRDNLRNRRTIEKSYLKAIDKARTHIIIANAYFLPGAKLRQALICASNRGVKVQLLLQGRYEYFLQYHASRPIYASLINSGIEIYEYTPSFLHAKVSVIDTHWVTIGSSNLDPLSLLLAQEANVVLNNTSFAQDLHNRLSLIISNDGKKISAQLLNQRTFFERSKDYFAYAVMRFMLWITNTRY